MGRLEVCPHLFRGLSLHRGQRHLLEPRGGDAGLLESLKNGGGGFDRSLQGAIEHLVELFLGERIGGTSGLGLSEGCQSGVIHCAPAGLPFGLGVAHEYDFQDPSSHGSGGRRSNTLLDRLAESGSKHASRAGASLSLMATATVQRCPKPGPLVGDSNVTRSGPQSAPSALADFHPAVRGWFEERFPEGPTEPQLGGWPAIAAGQDTLIAAPTGSGKTLSAFLVCIDRLYREAEEASHRTSAGLPLFADSPVNPVASESSPPGVQIVYVSPLKALAADIQKNLEEPLAEIAERARVTGATVPEIRVALRSGDTPASQRAAMVKAPPQILVTTPESLFLLVTAEKSREILRGVRTVIVDEIHAVARDKRGSHLALTLERLDRLCSRRPARVGLSATQRPIERISRLLVGCGPMREGVDGVPHCHVVDRGHRRKLDLEIQLPEEDLEAVASAEQMGDIFDQIAAHVEQHQTTLVFVNTRRLAERVAHELSERLGEGGVAAHHGSLSKDRRLRVESKLRAGELRALVATASLELGIDVGPVELVCQIGSPRGLSTFLQRVGRSGHSLRGKPKGRVYPTTRDELVECVALLRGVDAGRLDALRPPVAPLDILAQHIVAACAAESWSEDELFDLVRGAAPFGELSRGDFDSVVEMLSEGIRTGRGRRAAYLHRDRVQGVLRGRRGARLAALTSGGAIPEVADYRVVADPDNTFVGTVFEDFAIESMPGDVFLLGTTSWRIRRIESGVVRVVDAQGAPPSIPFWVGEAPARTDELSDEVSKLREAVADRLAHSDEESVRAWLTDEENLGQIVADQLVRYLGAGIGALGIVPTSRRIVFERFFDESGGMQLVVHSPLGGRINRALCLALRKKFCKNFNFELQAAANDDAMVLSLGPHHSFSLETVPRFVSSGAVKQTLEQAALASPMFTARWRWNLNRSLAVLRWKGGRKNPPPIQRMESDDLMAAVFPHQAACQENVSYPVDIPNHPLVRQTMEDCLTEAMDVEGLGRLIQGFESGEVETCFVDGTEASPFSHEILNGRPYTFLDDAPLEERRTRAVAMPRGLPVQARELARLDPSAIERVREEVRPAPRDAEELHDLLQCLFVMQPESALRADFESLYAAGRSTRMTLSDRTFWCATEKQRALGAVYPEAVFAAARPIPDSLRLLPVSEAEMTVRDLVRGHLEITGPIESGVLASRVGLQSIEVEVALAALESEGFALRGHFDREDGATEKEQSLPVEQWCARRLLTRIHSYTRDRLRRAIEPASAQDMMRFLLRWQHVAPDTRIRGGAGLGRVLEQMQGFEIAAGAWEESILPSRLERYQSRSLDALCLSGTVAWGRLAPRFETKRSLARDEAGAAARTVPSRATPITLLLRGDLPWLLQAQRGDRAPVEPEPGAAADILACLREQGALFHSDLVARLGRLPVEIEEGLWALVSGGWVTADGFQAVRALLGARARWARTRARARARRGLRRGLGPDASAEGRWSLLPQAQPIEDRDALAEAVAEQLLARWGVVFRDVLAREVLAVPWRELVFAFRRLEARGVIRGGRFVSGFSGEQFALPEAVESLRRVRRTPCRGERVTISGVDPLNLTGVLIPGARIPALRTQTVTYRDGIPVDPESEAGEGTAAGGPGPMGQPA